MIASKVHLRRHLLEQAMDRNCGGACPVSERSQPDGVRKVSQTASVVMVDDVRLEGLKAWARRVFCRGFITAYSPTSAAPLPSSSHPSNSIPVFATGSVSKIAMRAATSTSATPLPEPRHSSSPINVFTSGSRHPASASSQSSPRQRQRTVQVNGDSPPAKSSIHKPLDVFFSFLRIADPHRRPPRRAPMARIRGVDEPMESALVHTSIRSSHLRSRRCFRG